VEGLGGPHAASFSLVEPGRGSGAYRTSLSGSKVTPMPERRKGVPRPAKPNRGPAAGPENRRALIAAAREVFSADGLQAPFSAVGQKAGVGQGSLYRHFPARLPAR